MTKPLVPPEALAAQARSSDPSASVWVSANAGGAQDVRTCPRASWRLLLSGRAAALDPVLHAYTNAAAAEMHAGLQAPRRARRRCRGRASCRVAGLAPAAECPTEAAARAPARSLPETWRPAGRASRQTTHTPSPDGAPEQGFPPLRRRRGSFQILDDADTVRKMTESAIAGSIARSRRGSFRPDRRSGRRPRPPLSRLRAAGRRSPQSSPRGGSSSAGRPRRRPGTRAAGLDGRSGAVAEDLARRPPPRRIARRSKHASYVRTRATARALLDSPSRRAGAMRGHVRQRIAARARAARMPPDRGQLWGGELHEKTEGAPARASRMRP